MYGTRLTKAGVLQQTGANERFWLAGSVRLLALLVALSIGLLSIPGAAQAQTTAAEEQSSGSMTTLGATEQVVLVNEEGEEVEAFTRIDSGAYYTSIGYDLAEDLDLDLENAETQTTRSTLGEEQRR